VGRRKRRRSYYSRPSYHWEDRDRIDPYAPDGNPFDDDSLDEFDDDPFDDREPEWVVPQCPASARSPASRALPWKDYLEGIASAMRRPVAAWPPAREIEYVISVPDILVTGVVALDVGCRQRTVYCELEPGQRRLYDELRDHYRRSLLTRVDQVGLARSKIVVLEALLRLRQAACHPGLIDRRRIDEPAGKLDVLLPRVQEILEEGHKAIVFSQFTSFLAIVRRRLDVLGIAYEYLDGATRDRQARVTRFQTDPDRRLFLVSLKAGGLGLNLTAAEHVFLLDPWWNPAVEAQAIDRTHRIGQTRPVLAFRLIAPDTVEEKILALQRDKRDLAEAIVTAQNSLIRTLTREDLELLLS